MQLTTAILEEIITNLVVADDGKSPVFTFENHNDRERFRVAMYKQKKLFDELMMATDDSYNPTSMRFEKVDKDGKFYGQFSLSTFSRAPLKFEMGGTQLPGKE